MVVSVAYLYIIIRARLMYWHTDRCIYIYIGRYDDVADVLHRQCLLMKVLRCCSAWSVCKPKLLLCLWPCLIGANGLSCS